MYQWVSNGMFLPQSKMQSFLVTNAYGERITRTMFCQKCISYAVSSVCGSETYIFDDVIIIFYDFVIDITREKAIIKMIIDLYIFCLLSYVI